MIRVFKQYIPISFLVLGGLELLINGYAVVLGMRLYLSFVNPTHIMLKVAPVPLAAIFALVMLVIMIALGLYQRRQQEGMSGMAVRLAASYLLSTVVMGLVFYALPDLAPSRGGFLSSLGLAMLATFILRVGFIRWVVRHEALRRRVLVLGAGSRASSLLEQLGTESMEGVNLLGFIHMRGEYDAVDSSRVLRPAVPLSQFAAELQVDEIVVAVDDRRKGLPVAEILECKMDGIEVVDLLTFFEREFRLVKLEVLHPSWMIFSDGFRQGAFRSYTKRLFDIVAALLLLSLAWPLMLLTALFIWLESGGRGPVLFRQVRVGENDRPFTLYKFRSMRVDAESDGVARWAVADDDRVTRVGRLIRRVRLDELPQIFNVLKGDMSFVGPRPERPEFVRHLEEIEPLYVERHRVKPGITGWAQIRYSYGASDEDALRKLEYDLYYVKNYSLFFDFMILLQTVEVVLWPRGVH
jgi:sugar transferase (PEP-CTERM system associated)